jgi:hypothetical protein
MSPCARPASDAALLDWWSAELPAAEQGDLEEHLLACPACSGRALAMSAIAEALRGLVREGGAPLVLPLVVVERLRQEGRRIREYRVPPGGSVRCTVGPEDDVLLSRLAADLRGVTRLDLAVRVGDGPEQRLSDLPFDAAAGELIVMPPTADLRAAPAHVQRMRLLAVELGGERVLGEYTFDHTPWPGR